MHSLVNNCHVRLRFKTFDSMILRYFKPKIPLACYGSFYITTWYRIFQRVEQLLQCIPCGWRRRSVYLISNFIIICHDDEVDTCRNEKSITCLIIKQLAIQRIKIFACNKMLLLPKIYFCALPLLCLWLSIAIF